MGRGMILAITVIALIAYNLVDRTAAKTTHVVGDSLGGWYIQPFTPLAYVAWATTQTFTVGDVLGMSTNLATYNHFSQAS